MHIFEIFVFDKQKKKNWYIGNVEGTSLNKGNGFIKL